ncbi:CRISPR-associated endonuclease Cas1 [Candidatus Electrothrix sp.]|uniref:CRISPR-associated endonuclease Cas1 n=1 Tax=Candidatus Electrothrix sp. TaxID=2170559 RepID=UPI00405645B6
MQEILPCFQPLLDLSWQTLRLELRNTRNTFARQHPLAVFAAICKHAAKQAGIPHNQYFYHPLDGPPDDRIRKNTIYALELVFPASDTAIPDRFLSGLNKHLHNPRNNFSLHSSEPARTRCLRDLLTENPLRNPDEVCLEFLTPFPFTPKEQGQHHLIDRDIFFRKLEARIKRTFALTLPEVENCWQGVRLLSCYWEYYERQRNAGSNKGKQYLNGTVGPLYLRGDIEPIYPLLLLCSEISSGRRSSFGLGHYRLVHNRAFFEPQLTDRSLFLRYRQELLEQSDHQADIAGELLDPEQAETDLHQALLDNSLTFPPAHSAGIPKKDGSLRSIAILYPESHCIHYFLNRLLSPILDKLFTDAVIGYRPSRSRQLAKKRIVQAFHEGFTFVLKADIASFFDQINWQILEQKLDAILPVADSRIRALLHQCIQTRIAGPDGIIPRNKGLLQGSPLSPLLSNLYLDEFDEQLAGLGYRVVRYGDDFVIMLRSPAEGKVALADIHLLLEPLELSLQEEKTRLQPLDMGFTFLGLEFGAMIDEEFVERTTLKKTLFVQEQYAFIGVDSQTVVIKKGREMLARLPIHRISGLVLFGSNTLSSRLLQRCSQEHIPVSFCSPAGYYVNTLKPDSRSYFHLLAEHTNRHAALSGAGQVEIAAEIVTAKIENYLIWLQGRREPEVQELFPKLEQTVIALSHCAGINEVLGHEGAAAKLLFRAVNALVQEEEGKSFFQAKSRICHCRADPYNSLQDFASFLLFCKLNVLVRTRGLNPYLGILHSHKDSYESLVADLQEMFRCRMDRMVLRMLNLRLIQAGDFEEDEQGGVRLNREASGRFIDYFERELSLCLTGEPGTLKQLLLAQVSVIARWARDNQRLIWYNARSYERE